MKKIWYVYTMEFYSAIKRKDWVIYRDVNGPRVCHTELSKSEREKQIYHINTYVWNLKKKGTDEPICRAGTEMQMQRMGVWTRGREGG